jgi:DNA-binding transcriptional regulator LsrR (DeoR family)
MSNVIGIGGGEEKIDTIKAAISGNIIDVLITDRVTAKSLLKMKNIINNFK